jgi:hypothetical protein
MSAASVCSLETLVVPEGDDDDFQSVIGIGTPRAASPTHFNIATPPQSPRPMDTTTTLLPPVDPSEQQHFSNVPEAPRRSSKKIKKPTDKSGKKYKVGKFSKMTDPKLDEDVEQLHKLLVDDAEMQKQQKTSKNR